MRLALFLVLIGVATLAPIRSGSTGIELSDRQIAELVNLIDAQNHLDQRDELDIILAAQSKLSPADERRIFDESELNVFTFSNVLGEGFTADQRPQMARLFDLIDRQIDRVIEASHVRGTKDCPRSPMLKSLQSCSGDAGEFPARSAVRARAFARMLAEIYPDKRQSLLNDADQICDDIAACGVQFPSSVRESAALGDAIANQLLKSVALREQIALERSSSSREKGGNDR